MKKIELVIVFILLTAFSAVCQVVDTLYIKNGDRTLFGLYNRIDTPDAPKPVAIIAHGFNGGYESGKNYFKPLAEMGYNCFTFDFPCGSTWNRTDSNTMNMSIKDEQSDVETLIKFFSSRPEIDSRNIVLIGESQGGLVAALAAAAVPDKVSRLVLVYPAFVIPDIYNSRFDTPQSIPDTVRVWDVPLGKRYFQELRHIDTVDAMKKYPKPVLILQGDKDEVVPLESSVRAQRQYPDATLKIIPGAGHGFNPEQFELSMRHLKQFLTQTPPPTREIERPE